MNRRRLLGLAAALAAPAAARLARAQAPALPPEVAQALPGARLQGQGSLRYFGFLVYDARLWTSAQPVGEDWAALPFALELRYARSLQGEKIAERSLAEMRRQGPIAPADAARWLADLRRLIPDVKEGDRITGLNLPGRGARFYVDGRVAGEVDDPAFARRFFGIWLAPQTSEPGLRQSLLGGAAP